MEIIVWIGATVTLAGLAMLAWCIVAIVRARRAKLDDAALKARLQKVVALNLAALAVSGLGLMMVIVGVFLA